MLDKLVKYYVLLSAYFLVLAFLNEWGYYLVFNLSVLSFFSTTDLFFSFLPITLFLSVVGFFISTKHPDLSKEQVYQEHGFFKMMRQPTIGTFIVCIAFGAFNFWLSKSFGMGFKGQSFVVIFSLVLLFFFIRKKELTEFLRSGKMSNSSIMTYFFLIAVMFFVFGSSKGLEVKRNGSSNKYILKVNNQVIITNKTLFVIGENQANLFLYNKNDSSTRVIKKEQVDSFIVK